MRREHAVAALAALGYEVRLDLVRLLASTGAEGLPAGEIASRLNMPPASLSFHFQQLKRAGLITQQRQSRHLIYRANRQSLSLLLAFLGEAFNPGSGQHLRNGKLRPEPKQEGVWSRP